MTPSLLSPPPSQIQPSPREPLGPKLHRHACGARGSTAPGLVLILASWILGSLCLSLPAQEKLRLIHSLDGQSQQGLSVQGNARYLFAKDQAKEGLGSLRLAPSAKEKYYGFTLFDIRAHKPKALRLSVFQEGGEKVDWLILVEDGIAPPFNPGSDARPPKPSRNAASLVHTCKPGWNEVQIDLLELRSRDGSQVLNCSQGVRRFRWSRRAGKSGAGPVCFVDQVRIVGEPPAASALRELRKVIAKAEDGSQRARALREGFPQLEPADRVTLALTLIVKDDHERVRRACREALILSGSDEVLALIEAARAKARLATEIELAWVIASMPSTKARQLALKIVADRSNPLEVRVAAAGALGRRGIEADLATLAKACPTSVPWPLRAALVQTLGQSASKTAIDLLIEVLAKPGNPRIEYDAADSLTRLTGKDLGTSASAWRDWWKVQREGFEINDSGKRLRGAYGSFYGIPVLGGRLAFVLDTSGSMRDPVTGGAAEAHIKKSKHLTGLEIKTRLDLAKAELVHALKGVPKGSHVGIIPYSNAAAPLEMKRGLDKLSNPLLKKLVKRIEAMGAAGRTNIYDGLFRAFHPGKKPNRKDALLGPDTIFLLTDGNPSEGKIVRQQELRDAVLRWNLGRMVRIHSINVGERSAAWLRTLSRASGGVSQELTSDSKEK